MEKSGKVEPSVSPFELDCSGTFCERCPTAAVVLGKIGDIISREGLNPIDAKLRLRDSDSISSLSEACFPYFAKVLSSYTITPGSNPETGSITVPQKYERIISGDELPPLEQYEGEEKRSHKRGVAEEALTSLRVLSSKNGGDIKGLVLTDADEHTIDEAQAILTQQKQTLVYKTNGNRPPTDTMIKVDPAPRRRKLDM